MPLPFFDRRPRVAVIRMSGVIAARATGLGGPGLSAAGLAPVLERAFGLKRLAGVVLAINSPGGSPVQSSLIAALSAELAEASGAEVMAMSGASGAGVEAVLDKLIGEIGPAPGAPKELAEGEEPVAWSPL